MTVFGASGRSIFPLASAMVPLIAMTADGPALTAAAAATCLDASGKIAAGGIPAGYWTLGKSWLIRAMGRISCVVTTPGTARFDLRLGAAGTTVAFDTGALNLNVVAKVTVPWWLEILLTCRAVGATANLFGIGTFTSEAVVGAPLPSAGGNGSLMCPVGTPAVGGNFDNSVANAMDFFFTQTVATGSMTVHQFHAYEIN